MDAGEIFVLKADLIRRTPKMYSVEKPSICSQGLGISEHVSRNRRVISLGDGG